MRIDEHSNSEKKWFIKSTLKGTPELNLCHTCY